MLRTKEGNEVRVIRVDEEGVFLVELIGAGVQFTVRQADLKADRPEDWEIVARGMESRF